MNNKVKRLISQNKPLSLNLDTQLLGEFGFDVRRGRIKGLSSISIVGHNETLNTTERTLAPYVSGDSHPEIDFISSLRTLSITSTNVNDTSVGSGARTLLLTGLDTNYNIQTEIITLNGQTAVDTANTYVAINNLQVITSSGESVVNLGTIYVSDDTDAHTLGVPNTRNYFMIQIGWGVGYTALYTVPNNFSLYPIKFSTTDDATSNKPLIIKFYGNVQFGLPIYQLNEFYFTSSVSDFDLPSIPVFTEKSKIRLASLSESGTNKLTVFIQSFLVNEEEFV